MNEKLKKGNICYRSRVEAKIRANVTKNQTIRPKS